jgi:hypothetical protein
MFFFRSPRGDRQSPNTLRFPAETLGLILVSEAEKKHFFESAQRKKAIGGVQQRRADLRL